MFCDSPEETGTFCIAKIVLKYIQMKNVFKQTCKSKNSQFIQVCFMVFNITCNNISVISWCSVLLEEETGTSREYH
jgi:hypothetical protein